MSRATAHRRRRSWYSCEILGAQRDGVVAWHVVRVQGVSCVEWRMLQVWLSGDRRLSGCGLARSVVWHTGGIRSPEVLGPRSPLPGTCAPKGLWYVSSCGFLPVPGWKHVHGSASGPPMCTTSWAASRMEVGTRVGNPCEKQCKSGCRRPSLHCCRKTLYRGSPQRSERHPRLSSRLYILVGGPHLP